MTSKELISLEEKYLKRFEDEEKEMIFKLKKALKENNDLEYFIAKDRLSMIRDIIEGKKELIEELMKYDLMQTYGK